VNDLVSVRLAVLTSDISGQLSSPSFVECRMWSGMLGDCRYSLMWSTPKMADAPMRCFRIYAIHCVILDMLFRHYCIVPARNHKVFSSVELHLISTVKSNFMRCKSGTVKPIVSAVDPTRWDQFYVASGSYIKTILNGGPILRGPLGRA
jgi:hypothetical protein